MSGPTCCDRCSGTVPSYAGDLCPVCRAEQGLLDVEELTVDECAEFARRRSSARAQRWAGGAR